MKTKIKFSSPGKNGTWSINISENFMESCKRVMSFFDNQQIEVKVYPSKKPTSARVIIITNNEFKQFTIYNLTGHQAYILFKNSFLP